MTHERANTVEELLRDAEWMRALARRLLDQGADADDAFQDAWVVALEKDAGARPWIGGVLKNLARERWRGDRARRRREETAARAEAQASTADVVARAQAQSRLVAAVLALDEPQRSAILHHYFDGVSAAEIARRAGVPDSTVRNRLKRGIDELRRRLERERGAAWAAMIAPIAVEPARTNGVAIGLAAKIGLAAAGIAALTLAIWSLGGAEVASAIEPPAHDGVMSALAPVQEVAGRSLATTTRSESTLERSASTLASLDVRVTWADDGRPAPGVVVQVYLDDAPDFFVYAQSAETDARGVARFAALHPGRARASSAFGGDASTSVAAGEHRAVDIAIPPGIVVEGAVVDADGRAVSGAVVWLSDYGNPNRGHEVARTSGDGAFRLRSVPGGRHVAARARGFAPSPSRPIEGKPGDVIRPRIVMSEPGGIVRGLVRGPGGTPVERALVVVGRERSHMVTDADGRSMSSAPALRVRTDAAGRFELDGVGTGRVDIGVRAPELAPWSGSIQVAPDVAASVAVDLVAGANVRGVVRDGDGASLAGVKMGQGPYGQLASSATRTAADGSFVLEGLPAGDVEVYAQGRNKGKARATLALEAGVESTWNPVLVQGAGVAGRVVDAAGAPLVGWTVAAVDPLRPGVHPRSTRTDEHGAFHLENWPKESSRIEVFESDALVVGAATALEPVEPGARDLVIRVADEVRATSSIAGRVLDASGAAVDGAHVFFQVRGSNHGFREPTDARSGEFRIGPIRAGDYRLGIEAPGRGRLDVSVLALGANERRELGRITLEIGGTLRVECVDATGAPQSKNGNVYVRTVEGVRVCNVVFDGTEGRAGPLQPGTYVVAVAGETARAEQTVEVAAGVETAVRIVLEPATARVFEVVCADALDPADTVRFVVTDADGHVVFESSPNVTTHTRRYGVFGLRTGAYVAEATTRSGRSGRLPFEIADLRPADWMTVTIR